MSPPNALLKFETSSNAIASLPGFPCMAPPVKEGFESARDTGRQEDDKEQQYDAVDERLEVGHDLQAFRYRRHNEGAYDRPRHGPCPADDQAGQHIHAARKISEV